MFIGIHTFLMQKYKPYVTIKMLKRKNPQAIATYAYYTVATRSMCSELTICNARLLMEG